MKELLARPGFLGTHAAMGADISFLLAVVFTVIFLIGWYFAKKRQGSRHHTVVLWGMVSMLVYFTGYYQIRGLGVLAAEGREGFGGPDWVYSYLFKPTLTIHVLLVSIGIIMAVYMIILGFRASDKVEGKWLLREGSDLRVSGRNFYKYLLIILAVMALITVIRCSNRSCVTVYVVGYLIIAAVFFLVLSGKACREVSSRRRGKASPAGQGHDGDVPHRPYNQHGYLRASICLLHAGRRRPLQVVRTHCWGGLLPKRKFICHLC